MNTLVSFSFRTVVPMIVVLTLFIAIVDAQSTIVVSSKTVTVTQNSDSSKSHAFLLLGQSNMAGFPTAQAADKTQINNILVLGYDECSATGRHMDQWTVAVPPLHECWAGAIGPGDWFAKTMISKYPANDNIRLIPCAISGEKIETFLKNGGSKYSWIINRAKLAQQAGGVIEGILFHQGESNNGDISWPGKVKQLVQDLKADLGLGKIPFLAGELLYSGSCAGHNTLVNQLPNNISNCYVISASGLVVDPTDTVWHLHFGHDSQVELGKRYASKMISALGLATIVEGENHKINPVIPKDYSLDQCFPNPFNPTTTINFTLPSKLFVSLKVFDMLGREVTTIVSEEMYAGSYTRQWNATTMSSGVYFYRLQAGTFVKTKKLVLLR